MVRGQGWCQVTVFGDQQRALCVCPSWISRAKATGQTGIPSACLCALVPVMRPWLGEVLCPGVLSGDPGNARQTVCPGAAAAALGPCTALPIVLTRVRAAGWDGAACGMWDQLCVHVEMSSTAVFACMETHSASLLSPGVQLSMADRGPWSCCSFTGLAGV